MNQRNQIIEMARRIESLPPMAVQLVTMLQDPTVPLDKVSRLIEHEPAITANVLKLANTATFGVRGGIKTIQQALTRIGLRKTAELVMDVVLAPHAGKPVRGYNLAPGALWEHSVAVAIATDLLAEQCHAQPPIEAFTAGLLHDIGKLVLGHFVEVEFEPIGKLAFEQGLSFEQAEREVLGIDHAEVGAVLLDAWGIGGAVRDAVRWHHEPDEAPQETRSVVQLVHAAVQIVTSCGVGGGIDGCQYQSSESALQVLDIQPKLVEQVLRRLIVQLDDIQAFNRELTGSCGS